VGPQTGYRITFDHGAAERCSLPWNSIQVFDDPATFSAGCPGLSQSSSVSHVLTARSVRQQMHPLLTPLPPLRPDKHSRSTLQVLPPPIPLARLPYKSLRTVRRRACRRASPVTVVVLQRPTRICLGASRTHIVTPPASIAEQFLWTAWAPSYVVEHRLVCKIEIHTLMLKALSSIR
jgi:hypothetical protein